MAKTVSDAIGRRQFIAALGVGASLVAAAPIAVTGAGTETNDDKRKSRYRESEHVKTFYRVNRYPS